MQVALYQFHNIWTLIYQGQHQLHLEQIVGCLQKPVLHSVVGILLLMELEQVMLFRQHITAQLVLHCMQNGFNKL